MAWGESQRAISRHLGAMLILWLNKRVSHGSGVSAGTAPWLQVCIHTGVALQHSGSQSRTCSPETCGYLLVQRSSPPRRECLWQERTKWEVYLKTSLPT